VKPYQRTDLAKMYGSEYIDKRMNGYSRVGDNQKKSRKFSFLAGQVTDCLRNKLSIDFIIKELSFGTFALMTYLYMKTSGRIDTLGLFGQFIELILITVIGYNLFKASLKSLTPGIICLLGGFVLFYTGIHQHCFKFLTTDHIDYIIGMGSIFIALSLMTSNHN
jgi:hypothetical protein